MKQPVTVTHHGRNLFGTLFLPKADSFPLVLFSHGFNGHESDFYQAAETLAENGIGTFCFTFCGGSTRDKSGFPTAQMTLMTELEDLLAAIEFLKKRQGVQTDNVFLFGGSMGGAVSALAAERLSNDIRGLCLLFPALCIADDWNKRFPNETDVPENLNLWGMELSRKFFLTARKTDFNGIGKFTNPVLILHGDRDEIVPLSYSERAAKKYKNAELIIFPQEGHGFSKSGNKRVCELLLSFIKMNVLKI